MAMAAPLRLAELLGALSLVADLGFGLPPGEATRTCLIATGLARKLDVSEADVADVFYAALLQHIGCTATAHETALVFGNELVTTAAAARTNYVDPRDVFVTFFPAVSRSLLGRVRLMTFFLTRGRRWAERSAAAVCDVARETARRIGLSQGVQHGLGHIDECWNGRGNPQGLEGDAIALPARITLAAEAAALFDGIGGPELAVDALRQRSGGMLDPAIVEVLIANAPALLEEADAGDPRQHLLEVEPRPVLSIAEPALPGVAAAFADVADLKSPYTHGHSTGVARIAVAAGENLGLDASEVRRLEVAALLHDLGRVGISDAIWEKPGPLNSLEQEQVRLHPYHSERILAASASFRPLATLAGMHHEHLDASGYPRGCRASEIPMPARVLAAADAYQAMTQRRPHRDALSADRAADELSGESRGGRLDADAIAAVLQAVGRPRAIPKVRPSGLSDREIEVLRLVAEGCSNRELAGRLYISPRTAEHHIQHVYAKIGVSSRAGAALFAMEHDLLGPK